MTTKFFIVKLLALFQKQYWSRILMVIFTLLSAALLSYQSALALTSVNSSSAGGVRSGLVGYWTFDGKNMTNATATDISGRGNNGTLTNMTQSTSRVIGKIGQAVALNGVDKYVSISGTSTVQNVSYWIKPSNSKYSIDLSGAKNYFLHNGLFSGTTTSVRYINGVVPTAESLGSELVTNGGAETGTTASWNFYDEDLSGATGLMDVTSTSPYAGLYSFDITITNDGSGSTDVQFYNHSTPFSTTQGDLYKVQFAVRGSTNFTAAKSAVFLTDAPFTSTSVTYTYDITTSWVLHTYYFYARRTGVSDNRVDFMLGNIGTGHIYLDAISVKRVNSVGDLRNNNWEFVSVNLNNPVSANSIKLGKLESDYTNGTLDDVRFYNRQLTTTEIKSLYKAGGGVSIDTSDRVEFITTPGASTWTVPQGVYAVKVEAIGGGGGGGTGSAGSGGGGGAYAVKRNISVTPGSTISVNVGAGGATDIAGADTTFNTSVVVAKGGSAGVAYSNSSTSGGSAASSIPSSGAFSGGNGGGGDYSYNSGGGGGGAASYLGAGGSGGAAGASKGGAGGGGSGKGSAGAIGTNGGANGGGNDLGVGGGAPPAGNGSSGGSGIGHSAGGGSGGFSNFNSSSFWPGGSGGNGIEWDVTHGSGAGGGGGGSNGGGAGGVGGNGGNYGGGGGGGGNGVSGGAGGNGLLVITYKVGKTTATVNPTSNNRTGINSGLVGHWTFDGKNMTNITATDVSGNGNNGTLTNMTRNGSAVIGKIGQALSFNGSSYITFPHTTALNLYPISFGGWFKTNYAAGSRAGFVSKYTGGSANGWESGITNKKVYAYYFGATSDTGGPASAADFNDGKWHHSMNVVDANGMTMYVDGIVVATSSWTAAPSVTTSVSIGRIGEAHANADFPGSLDDIRVYNRALSAQEVKTLYKLGAQ